MKKKSSRNSIQVRSKGKLVDKYKNRRSFIRGAEKLKPPPSNTNNIQAEAVSQNQGKRIVLIFCLY